jgi:hypothetical protein
VLKLNGQQIKPTDSGGDDGFEITLPVSVFFRFEAGFLPDKYCCLNREELH